jgi:two-component system, LytTR family, sensor kinase
LKNPFLQRLPLLLLYFVWWILPGGIHFFVLSKIYQTERSILIADSLISYSIFAFLGLSIWWMVRYSNISEGLKTKTLQNHLWAMILVFLIWTAASLSLLSLIDGNYHLIFIDTMIWRLLIFLPFYFILIIVYYLFASADILRDKELVTSKIESQLKEAELNALKSQINPHFLFNALNSAAALTLSNPAAAREMIVAIASFFRVSLTAGKQLYLSLEEEIDNALLYLEIEKGRFGDKIQIESKLPETMRNYSIPSMILQPIVENCIKHGVYESSIPVLIQLSFEDYESYYRILIQNTYDPLASPYKKGTGTGLINVSARLELIYKQSTLINTHKQPDTFLVSINIPKTH